MAVFALACGPARPENAGPGGQISSNSESGAQKKTLTIAYGRAITHIGPMAHDFHSLFPFNDNDKMLNECDLHGVALAAIQGLSRKIQAQDTELKARESQIEQMRIRLDQLEKVVLGFQHEPNH